MMSTQYEKVYVCVDDTDDLTKATSTGKIAEEIASAVEKEFDVRIRLGITRHQLFLDPSVPYTSHNSSMCFDVILPTGSSARVDEIGWEKIRSMRAESANPGLCILAVPYDSEDMKTAKDLSERYAPLLRFGTEAKVRYVEREEAVLMAEQYPEIILKWDGETGQGRIGALAGVGLRMSGADGRFRGKLNLKSLTDKAVMTVKECIDLCVSKLNICPLFADDHGNQLDPDQILQLTDQVKPVLMDGRMTILCSLSAQEKNLWLPHSKDKLPNDNPLKKKEKKEKSQNREKHQNRENHENCENHENRQNHEKESCPHFILDPDEEERFNEKKKHSCGSCLYRRLTSDGYECSYI